MSRHRPAHLAPALALLLATAASDSALAAFVVSQRASPVRTLRRDSPPSPQRLASAVFLIPPSSPSDDDDVDKRFSGGGSDSDDSGDGTAWIREAMGEVNSADGGTLSLSLAPSPRDGLAGFAVDPARGFGAVLVASSGDDNASDGDRHAIFAVISPGDRERIMTAEALTLVQLAGGIDVATAVFPPDALRRAAYDDDEDNGEGGGGGRGKEGRITLVGVEAIHAGGGGGADAASEEDGGTNADEAAAPPPPPPSSLEREAKLAADAPRLERAVRSLPGLGKVSIADVLAALRLHADADGALDRDAFTELLGTLRRKLVREAGTSGLRFVVTLALEDRVSVSTKTLEVPAFTALALSMRHEVPVGVASGCREEHGFGVDELIERYPAFRPIEELREDAKAIDGFIPELFFKHKPPKTE